MVAAISMAAAKQPAARSEINIGTGRETSVLDLVDVLRESGTAGGFDPLFEPPRLGEIQRSCLDVSRAREVLGWEAQVDLRAGMRATLATVGVT